MVNTIFYETYAADCLTPVAIYKNLRDKFDYSLLYESVEKAKSQSRYSIIAADPDLIWSCKGKKAEIQRYNKDNSLWQTEVFDHPIASLRDLQKQSYTHIPSDLPSSASGLYGYFSYDMVRHFEKLPPEKKDPLNLEDAILWRPRILLIFDNLYDIIYNVITFYDPDVGLDLTLAAKEHFDKVKPFLSITKQNIKPLNNEACASPDLHFHTSQETFEANVKKAIDYIYEGDIFQVVPSQRIHFDFAKDSLDYYRTLRRINPSPYMFHAQFYDMVLVGASPEILVKLSDNNVTIRPIAGTRPRGETPQKDLFLEQDLLNDPKEMAEHLMLLDLARNDVGRVSKTGSVKVTEEFIIEKYSHVMHIVSNVTGELLDKYDFLEAVFSALPVGTVSGAPKIRAMEIINELETEKRGFYAGGIGYFSNDGSGDLALMLRTALIKDKKIYIQAGAGVVADSIPAKEYQETLHKAGALIKAATVE